MFAYLLPSSCVEILITITVLILAALNVLHYKESPSFRYKVKFSVYTIYILVVSFLCLPFAMFNFKKKMENMLWITPLIQPGSRILGIEWEIEGAEIFDKEFPCVIVCNHQSILDALGLAQIWPRVRKCAAVAKKELLYIFPFGCLAWICGTVFVDRSKGKKALGMLSMSAESIKGSGTRLWIFPEGTRHKGETLLPFKKGAFHIAIQNKLPILPVVISPYSFIDDGKKIFDTGRVIMSVLPLIETDGITDVNEVTDKTREKMCTEFERLTKVVYSSTNSEEKLSSRRQS